MMGVMKKATPSKLDDGCGRCHVLLFSHLKVYVCEDLQRVVVLIFAMCAEVHR